MEQRAFLTEIRAADGDDARVSGLGIVYDQWTELWPGYMERISRGAVKNAETVKSFFNHDPDYVLSTLDSDPALVLRETESGLEYDSPIPPTTYGNDLKINLQRKNVRGSSFAFDVNHDAWSQNADGVVCRDITDLTLYEVGPVTNPAYIQTTATMRSKELVQEYRKQLSQVPIALRKRQQEQIEKTI
ncbi:MAG: HK97 family phage prohead protease [Kiritimatiellae bacterium]|nr:HK97 family phage prohead protease [Kiritimatiellia bacterium]